MVTKPWKFHAFKCLFREITPYNHIRSSFLTRCWVKSRISIYPLLLHNKIHLNEKVRGKRRYLPVSVDKENLGRGGGLGGNGGPISSSDVMSFVFSADPSFRVSMYWWLLLRLSMPRFMLTFCSSSLFVIIFTSSKSFRCNKLFLILSWLTLCWPEFVFLERKDAADDFLKKHLLKMYLRSI